ncbi:MULTISPECIES: polymorphic toxin-type HINT domain-containing protein [unclassified Kitasatospora]|uniref:polymorphic toxin-type HINT domain-containing protein n=1 Tax=unclassified Kitasatospora TaxID=2633591 RepID=UPI0024749BBB|nr:polymorphic toxin-type HINT domain-containing protein [Kitasatospora sp. MAP12-44]
MFVVMMATLTAPSAAALGAKSTDKVWDPPNTPLGAQTKAVKGKNLKLAPIKPPAYPVPKPWVPQASNLQAGTATIVVGSGSAEAQAARAATGGASPAAGGDQPVRAGNLPVALAASSPSDPTRSLRVDVSDAAKGKAAGVPTPLVTLTDPAATSGSVKVALDLKALAGQNWDDRARLVALPACALTTPDAADCRKQTPVASTVDPASGTLTADVALPAAGSTAVSRSGASSTVKASLVQASSMSASMVLAAVPSSSGSGGNYGATSLSPSSDWSSGSNAGNFTYSYPIQVPPPLGGLAPSIDLSYDSSSVDGRNSAQNSQSSWIGDGWDYQPGFIERSYKSCSKDGITSSGDMCWGGQNATISLQGHSGTLVHDDATGVWHLQGDDGSKVEQLTGAPNGLPTGEYWRVTTGDGTQYYFGQNHLPGGDGTDPASNSAWSEPVYSPNSGDPCNSAATGQASWCTMGWRWNLDYVVDVHQDLISYAYGTESNQYNRGGGQNSGSGTMTSYVRGGYLKQIAYGQRLPEQVAAHGSLQAADLVNFGTAERCLPSGSITCTDAQRTTANANYWPDVPLDQVCDGTTTCTNYSPSFFTTKRLTSISTQVLVGSSYSSPPVDSWALSQSLRDPGDGTKASLWLDSVVRTGATGGTAVSLPAVTFTPVELANRVDGLVPAAPQFNRPRIQQITTETGGQINVIYSSPACSRVNGIMPSSEDGNTRACMPVKWYLPGSSSTTPVNDWFNKYLVTAVTEQDAVTGSLIKSTNYTYNGDAAWHRNDAEFTDSATRTWDNFRGYSSVTTTTGSAYPGEAPKTQQTITYLRGMDGDYKADGSQRSVSVTSPLGPVVTDSDWLAGSQLATQNYSQAGGQLQSMTGTTSNGQQTTATHAQSGGMPPLVARYPASQATTISKSLLADGTWRTTTTSYTSDPAHGGRPVQTDDLGDGTAATPEICTTSSYATSSNPMLLTTVLSEKKAVTGPCGTTATAANTVSDTRTLYDGQQFGQAGALGEATSAQVLDHYDTSGNPVYANTGSTTFDVYGRAQSTGTTDGSTYAASGAQLTGATTPVATTSTAYTPATGAIPTSVKTTGPLGWISTVTQDPGRSLPLTATDPNGRVTTEQYDGLGRLAAVWTPDRATNLSASIAYTYAINGTTAPSVVTTRTLRETLPGSTDFSWKTELYDGLGRLKQTQTTLPTGGAGRLISDTAYDSHGWAIKTSAPYYDPTTLPNGTIFSAQDSQIPSQTWISYDGMGRVTSSAFMSFAQPQWSTTTAYPGADRTDVTPPQGATPTSTVTDARGQTTALWQYRTPTATGHSTDADVTNYTYTPAGQPATRTDTSGNTWSYSYDQRGRQTSATDPDTGTSQTFYNADSQVDHTTDAKGNTLAYSYDLLGRKTAMYNGSVAPANQLAGWTYDTLADGQLTSSTRYVGGASGQAYTEATTGYDTAYRPLGTSVTIPASEGALTGTYTTTNTYNPVLGTLAKTTLPALGGLPAETVGYHYTTTGSMIFSAGNDYLVTRVLYDAYGNPIRTTLGGPGAQVVSTQQYDDATGRVVNSWIDRQSGTVSVDQTGYTYNPAGQITSASDRQDSSATDTQCYTYDYLGRLTNAWTDTGTITTKPAGAWTDTSGAGQGTGTPASVPGIGSCTNATGPAKTAGATSVGGPAPYWQSYGYDASGNRTSLTQHDITGNTANDTTTTQAFATTPNTATAAPNTGGGTGGPHALLSTTTTGPAGTTASSYQYDQLGNTTAVTSTSGTTSLTWNGEDQLASVSTTGQAGSTSYLYDADGNQLIRRDPGKTTLNLGADELTLDTASGSMSDVRYYSSPGGVTITRVTAATGGGSLVYQAADPHGTNGVQITTGTTQTVTRRPTDPFGNPRGTQPAPNTWSGDKGFVGGTQDPVTGLTNLGAREYDPVHGRFLNPDPLLDTSDPQQWNGYAYSGNDPVSSSDPTGRMRQLDYYGDNVDNEPACTACLTDPTPDTHTPIPDTSGFGKPANTTTGNGSGSGGNSKPKKKSTFLGNPVSWAWDHKADIAETLNFVAVYSSCMSTAGLGSVESFGATAVAGIAGCGALAGLAGSAAHNLADSKGPQESNLAGAVNGAYGAVVAAGAGVALKPILGKVADSLASCSNSFPAGTPVLLADGTTKPINKVTEGDKVAASDPQTGSSAAEPVTHTITTPDDQEFTDLTLLTAPDGKPTVLTSTQHHPLWDVTTGRWTNASDVHPGDQLHTANGTTVTVQAIRNYHTEPRTAYNLTVAQLHTYYVLAGTTPVLVHNSCGPVANNKPGDLALEMMEADFAGVTPMTAGTPEFAQATSGGGRFLWAVGEDGALHVIPDAPGLHHTVMTGGNSVIGAGQVTITSRGVVSSIDNMTGHYTPCPECAAKFLQQGVSAFEQAGIRVPLSAIKDYGGRAP